MTKYLCRPIFKFPILLCFVYVRYDFRFNYIDEEVNDQQNLPIYLGIGLP